MMFHKPRAARPRGREQQMPVRTFTFHNRAMACAATGPPSGRYMSVVQSDEHSFYWGGHDRRDTPASTAQASISGSVVQAATEATAELPAASVQQLLVELNNAESAWQLLEIAQGQQHHMQLQHWLRLLFRLFVMLHEDDQIQQCTEHVHDIHSQLPHLIQHAAEALNHQAAGDSSSSTIKVDQQRQQHLVGQIADMLFAMATYAIDCQQQAAAAAAAASSASLANSINNNNGAWYRSASCAAMIDAVASYSSSWNYQIMLRQDAVSLLWACGKLSGIQQPGSSSSRSSGGGSSSTCARHDFFYSLCSSISTWIRYANNTAEVPAGLSNLNRQVLDDWAPDDLIDSVAGLAAAQHKSQAAAQLLDAAAHEVYRQLSNRHSTAGSFTVDGAVNLLGSYAQLQYKDGPSLRMFDAAAGWFVKRIRARHVQAPSNPKQIAAVAAAFAQLQHRSVVVPELLTALNLQAARAAASAVEISSQTSDEIAQRSHAIAQPSDNDLGYCLWTLAQAAVFLKSHVQLGYKPCELMLLSLAPALVIHITQQQQQQQQQGGLQQQPPPQQQFDALTVLDVFATLRHHPGQQVLRALMDIAWSGSQQTLNPRQLVTLLFSSAQLAAAPPAAATLEAVVDDILLAAICSSSSSRGSNQAKQQALSASDIIRVLWSLLVFDAINIQRLGWLLVGVAGGSWNKLEDDQLLVIKQAQIVLGAEGLDMSVEVLPPQLLSRVERAWEKWCSVNTVLLPPGSSSSDPDGNHGSSSSSGGTGSSMDKPRSCDASWWTAHWCVHNQLQERAAAAAKGSLISVKPVIVVDDSCSNSGQMHAGDAQQLLDRQLIGAWLLKLQQEKQQQQQQQQQQQSCVTVHVTWPEEWPQSLQQPLAFTQVLATQQQQQQQQQRMRLLLVCHSDWYNSNEPHQPLGAAFAHLSMVKALLLQQQQQEQQQQQQQQQHGNGEGVHQRQGPARDWQQAPSGSQAATPPPEAVQAAAAFHVPVSSWRVPGLEG